MQDKGNTTPLIQTKLYRPPIQSDFISRPQLLEQFDGWQQRPLTLVSAPAGYGKSMLVSSWLELLDVPAAWISPLWWAAITSSAICARNSPFFDLGWTGESSTIG